MRVIISIVGLIALLAAPMGAQQQELSSQELLDRGLAKYRQADFSGAAADLSAAAEQFLSPDRMQAYVNTGRFEHLDRFETALIYLALAQAKAGQEEEARQAVLRLITAERIEPTYARLSLAADAQEFEALASRLVPGSSWQPNTELAAGGAPAPAPPVVVAQAPAQPPAPSATIIASAPPPAPTPVVQGPAPGPPASEGERAERQRIIDEIVAQERARIQRAADERIAAERAAIQKAADERIAAERAAAQRAAEERVAAALKAAEQRVAEAERLLAEARRLAEERIAAERAAAQRLAEERIAAEREAMERAAQDRIASLQSQNRRSLLTTLREAESRAVNEELDAAQSLYTRILVTADAPRDILAEAAVGLYRIGAFRNAVDAFARLGAFARGEEDLRYYHAVALYETGRYDEARKELSCALPFIQVTDEVSRYRLKIEETSARR